MTDVVTPPKKRSFFKHPLVRLGGSALVLGLLFTALPYADIAAAIKSVPPIVWPAALAMYMSLHLVGIVKWRILVNAAGADLSFRTAARAYYMGLFGNTFLPSIVGGCSTMPCLPSTTLAAHQVAKFLK